MTVRPGQRCNAKISPGADSLSQRGWLMRALVNDVLAEGIQVIVAAEVAHRTSILPMVLNGIGRAVMPSSLIQSARCAGARVQRITPETYLHVAAVSRRAHIAAPAAALMAEARRYSMRAQGPWPSLRQTMAAVGHHYRLGDERGQLVGEKEHARGDLRQRATAPVPTPRRRLRTVTVNRWRCSRAQRRSR